MPLAAIPKQPAGSNIYNLVWYDLDHDPVDGRPDGAGGWWPLNPNQPGTVPDDGKQYRTATPLLGLYQSASPALLRQHAYWLSAMGANGVIVDWSNVDCSRNQWVYAKAIRSATDALMSEFSQATADHPQLKVVIAIRMQDTEENTRCVADDANQLYTKYPSAVLRLSNGTPTSQLPLLDVFVNFTAAWKSAPQWSDSRFDLRFSNGYLIKQGLAQPLGSGSVSKISGDLPYWNYVENEPDPNRQGYFQTLVRNFSLGGQVFTEQSAAWVAIHLGGLSWAGIAENTFARSIEPFYSIRPQVLVLNRFNYAEGWYAQPQEGLSANTATMLEPNDQYGYGLLNLATQCLSRVRGFRTEVPGPLSSMSRQGDQLLVSQDGWPLEYRVSPSIPNDSAEWKMIVPTGGKFSIPLGAGSRYLQTRNSFGASSWIPLN